MAERIKLPRGLGKQIREEQEHRCAGCGECKPLEIHHKIPVSFFPKGAGHEANKRENLCGLCGTSCTGCHGYFNDLAINHNIFFDQILIDMKEGVDYPLRRINNDIGSDILEA